MNFFTEISIGSFGSENEMFTYDQDYAAEKLSGFGIPWEIHEPMKSIYEIENVMQEEMNMTKEEARLWYQFLCRYPDRFRRQYVIGNYIADFYCHKAKLVIEIDGGGHYEEEKLKEDAVRTAEFESMDLKVLRICNLDIDKNFYGVCSVIDDTVKRRYRRETPPVTP